MHPATQQLYAGDSSRELQRIELHWRLRYNQQKLNHNIAELQRTALEATPDNTEERTGLEDTLHS